MGRKWQQSEPPLWRSLTKEGRKWSRRKQGQRRWFERKEMPGGVCVTPPPSSPPRRSSPSLYVGGLSPGFAPPPTETALFSFAFWSIPAILIALGRSALSQGKPWRAGLQMTHLYCCSSKQSPEQTIGVNVPIPMK